MHYSYLVTIDVPKIIDQSARDAEIEAEILRLQKEKEKDSDNPFLNIRLSLLYARQNAFAREVYERVYDVMEPYCECTEEEEYLYFDDYTEELRDEYENKSIDCIRLPEGSIVSIDNYKVFNKFFVDNDGRVYQNNFGRLHLPKRSKRAKKMVGYKNYPYKKLYKTFDDFATKERHFDYDEKHKGYGYLYNPDAFWDWLHIGGRWPKMFLVKDSCQECSLGERSWCNEGIDYEAPDGYKWVVAARKKDIEWHTQFEWNLKQKTMLYYELLESFKKGECPDGWCAKVVENGIISGGEMVYTKGETLEDFLTRFRVTEDYPYQIFPYGYLHDGNYVTKESIVFENGEYKDIEYQVWYQKLKELFDEADDDKVLVGVDCHI